MNTYKFNTMAGIFFIEASNLYDAVAKARKNNPNVIIKKEYIKLVKTSLK
jgi:hypothetical protein